MHKYLFMDANKSLVNIFDLSLTPENARAKGYEYIDDISYDLYVKYNTLDDFLKYVAKNDFKLGTPTQRYNYATFYGIYTPYER